MITNVCKFSFCYKLSTASYEELIRVKTYFVMNVVVSKGGKLKIARRPNSDPAPTKYNLVTHLWDYWTVITSYVGSIFNDKYTQCKCLAFHKTPQYVYT